MLQCTPPPPPHAAKLDRAATPWRFAAAGRSRSCPALPTTPLQRHADAAAFAGSAEGRWVNTIPDAPVFSPTAEEWADPIGYIRSIQGAVRDWGIARIVSRGAGQLSALRDLE